MQTVREFFRDEPGLALEIASLRHSNLPAHQIENTKAMLAAANYIVAEPDPTMSL